MEFISQELPPKGKSLGYLILRGMHHVALVNNGRIGGIFYHVT